jgi:low affinity Fe/Cu permease
MRAAQPIGTYTSPSDRPTGNWFSRVANSTAHWTCTPGAFLTAVAIIVVWAITGPIFHYSDTWQLVINTGTTIVTFLMVFLIQNTQNRDTLALQVKLAELILAEEGAHNTIAVIEEEPEEAVEEAKEQIKEEIRKRNAPRSAALPSS